MSETVTGNAVPCENCGLLVEEFDFVHLGRRYTGLTQFTPTRGDCVEISDHTPEKCRKARADR